MIARTFGTFQKLQNNLINADTDVTTTQNVQGQQTDSHTGTVTTVSERAGSIGVITQPRYDTKERAVAMFSFYAVVFF